VIKVHVVKDCRKSDATNRLRLTATEMRTTPKLRHMIEEVIKVLTDR
jgi:hypothetical protein